jgi:hypothetical protein
MTVNSPRHSLAALLDVTGQHLKLLTVQLQDYSIRDYIDGLQNSSHKTLLPSWTGSAQRQFGNTRPTLRTQPFRRFGRSDHCGSLSSPASRGFGFRSKSCCRYCKRYRMKHQSHSALSCSLIGDASALQEWIWENLDSMSSPSSSKLHRLILCLHTSPAPDAQWISIST